MIEARRIWLMDQRIFRAQRQHKKPPFVEHILSGYQDHKATNKLNQLRDLSKQCCEKKVILKSGAEVILLLPIRKSSQVLVSFHGGPESYEGTEIRYLGLYRDLLRKGWTVVILNYRGSTHIQTFKKQAWKDWKNSITQDFSDLIFIEEMQRKSISLLGASFGGALALTVSKIFKINKVVLFSPLLDLKSQKIRAGQDYKRWFNLRFSKKDYTDFSFNQLAANISTRSLVIFSQRDEVLGNTMNFRFINFVKGSSAKIKIISQQASHCPKSYLPAYERFNSALIFLNE